MKQTKCGSPILTDVAVFIVMKGPSKAFVNPHIINIQTF